MAVGSLIAALGPYTGSFSGPHVLHDPQFSCWIINPRPDIYVTIIMSCHAAVDRDKAEAGESNTI